MKEENYLYHIGRFHRVHMGQSIPYIVIGWTISLDMFVHKYQLFVLWISWTSGKCYCYYHYYCCCVLLPSTVLLFILHLPSPPRVGQVVWELCLSFMPGLLCGSNLERGQGILDDRSHGDICVVCCWGLVAVYVLWQGGDGRCMNVVLLDRIVGPSVALVLRLVQAWACTFLGSDGS